MEPREVKTLLLIEAVDKDGYRSQRGLSRKLNMSLGLVNIFIKNLTTRGIIKILKLPKNRMRYILSQRGIFEKEKLTMQYISYSISYYNSIKKRVTEILTALENIGTRKIILYGTGELCEIACIIICDKNIKNVEIIDDNKSDRLICGRKIKGETELTKLDFAAIVIMDIENTSIIRRKLQRKGVPSDKIITFFDRDFICKHVN